MSEEELLINIDGASLGNPGAAGIGLIIRDKRGKTLRKISEPIGIATNNTAEYTALIRALEEAHKLREPAQTKLLIRTDSELLQRQFTGQYRVKSESLKPLFLKAISLAKRFSEVVVVHVPREKNQKADKLASSAAIKQSNETINVQSEL